MIEYHLENFSDTTWSTRTWELLRTWKPLRNGSLTWIDEQSIAEEGLAYWADMCEDMIKK